jgi:hypothetical protein
MFAPYAMAREGSCVTYLRLPFCLALIGTCVSWLSGCMVVCQMEFNDSYVHQDEKTQLPLVSPRL